MVEGRIENVMTGLKSKRRGTCMWCNRHQVHLNYTIYVMDGAFHGANVCDRCLEEYRDSLERRVTDGSDL